MPDSFLALSWLYLRMYLLPAAGAYTSGWGWKHPSLWSMPGKSANVSKPGASIVLCGADAKKVDAVCHDVIPCPPLLPLPTAIEGKINESSSEMRQSHLAVPDHTRTDVRGPVPYFSFHEAPGVTNAQVSRPGEHRKQRCKHRPSS